MHSIDKDRVARLKDLGYKPRFAQVKLSDITGHIQTRAAADDRRRIAEYRTAMRNGADFPSPVMTQDLVVVSGKRTTAAYQGNGVLTIKAIVLEDFEYASATQAAQEALDLVDYEFNQQNGDRMTDEEIRRGLIEARNRGLTLGKMSELFGKDQRWLSYELAKLAGEERLTELGLDDLGLKAPQWRALGRLRINDDPFKSLARLSADANLNVADIDRLGSAIKEARSDNAAISLLDKARVNEYAAQITQVNRTGRVKRSDNHYALFTAAVSAVAKYHERGGDVLLYQAKGDPTFKDALFSRINEARQTLDEVAALLDQ